VDDPEPIRETEAIGAPRSELVLRRLTLQPEAPGAAAFTPTRPRTTIGAHRSNDLVIDDPALSRFHCELVLSENGVLVRDLESLNGTWIDGVRIAAAYLNADSVLTIGKTSLRCSAVEPVAVPLAERTRFGSMVGRSDAMRAVFAVLERAAPHDATVLLQGETGTGKDIAAESIHTESRRSDKPFVAVDCGALPPTLLESELFGHEKGAFTGAERARVGAFEAASGGTLFLDEIGELGLDLQPKFLRALESREIRRVGGTETIPVDVRVIAASNRDLQVEVNARRFRSDLYYRLAVVVVTLPPLRERTQDLELLAAQLAGDLDGGPPLLADAAFVSSLARHAWPGNVRELRNYLERCVAMGGPVPLATSPASDPPAIDTGQPFRAQRERWVTHFERRYLEQILREHGGSVTRAAKAAGVDRVSLHRLISRLGLTR
jgi:transcriptional regulator with PAS, ATPase and Fis domain